MKKLLIFLVFLVSSTFAFADEKESEKLFGDVLAEEHQMYPAYYYLVRGAQVKEGDVEGVKYYNPQGVEAIVDILKSFLSETSPIYPIIITVCTLFFLFNGFMLYKKVGLGQEEMGRGTFYFLAKTMGVMMIVTYLLPVSGRLCIGLVDAVTDISYKEATSRQSSGRQPKIKTQALAPLATDTTISYIMMSDVGQSTVDAVKTIPEETLNQLWGEKTKSDIIVVIDEWTANIAHDHRKIIECFEGRRDYGQTAKELAAYYGQGAWVFANILGTEKGVEPRKKHLAFLKSLRTAQMQQLKNRIDLIHRTHSWSDEDEAKKTTFGYMTLPTIIKPEAVEITRPPTLAESYIGAAAPKNRLNYATVSKLPETVQSATKYAGIQQALSIWLIPLSLAIICVLFAAPKELLPENQNPMAFFMKLFVVQALTAMITYALLRGILDAGTAPLGIEGGKYGVGTAWDSVTKDGGSFKNIFLNASGSSTNASIISKLIIAAPAIALGLLTGGMALGDAVKSAADNHAAKNAASTGIQKAGSAVSSFASKNWWVPGMAGINAARSVGSKLGSLFNSRR